MADLTPPDKASFDPGAHDLESSIGDGKELSAPKEDTKSSRSKEPPIPITVVQKVDEALRHGEVAGTKAHSIRSGDAEPDHVQIVGDAKHPTEHSNPQTSSTAEVSSIPLTIVDVVDSEKPSYGQVPGTVAAEMRKNDAQPDAIRRAPEELGDGQLHDKPSNYPLGISMKKAEAPVTDLMMVSTSPKTDRESKIPDKEMVKEEDAAVLAHEEERETDHCDTDILDDDFDEFAEEQSGDDAEFGQFSQDAPQMTRPVSSRHPVFQPTDLAFPALQLDASAMDARTVLSITDTLLPCIFPSLNPRSPKFHAQPVYDSELPPFGPSPFLTPRSASLWEQLIAPPTLQPFSWTRSHVRRLFLISLGVAVDLDEILPKAPQKKLNLPSTSFAKDTARITAERDDGQGGASMDRDSGRIPDPRLLVAPSGIDRTSDGVITNSPSASPAEPTPASTSSTIRYKRRRGPPPPPKFEASLFRALCETTTTDLKDLSDTGLQEHAEQVYQARELAGEVLQYWNMRKAEASAEKEALEGVVENLVRHARSSRLGPGSKMKGRKKK